MRTPRPSEISPRIYRGASWGRVTRPKQVGQNLGPETFPTSQRVVGFLSPKKYQGVVLEAVRNVFKMML